MNITVKSLLVALNIALLSCGTSVVVAEPAPPIIERQTPGGSRDTIPFEVVAPTGTEENLEPVEVKKSPSNPETTATGEKLKLVIAERHRQRKLVEADQLYLGGQFAAAEKIYRQVKTPFSTESETQKRPEPILDSTQLAPAAKVYWREAEAGLGQKLETRVMVPLRLLVKEYPEFIPGHLRLAEALQQYNRQEAALDVLEKASILYPEQPELIKARVAALATAEKWMDASLAARRFAILHYNQPQADEFIKLADENLARYKKHLRSELRSDAIANVITGALGYALTGSLFGPFSALDTTIMLLRGESAVGESVAKDARKQLQVVDDKAVNEYVNELGQKLAQVAGRNDFKYEFYVVYDNDLNAFALPGGKVFINTGAIINTNSEAELAGLLAHELSHAVLSHGFQLVAEGNLIANVTQFVPLGNTLATVFTLKYSRDMERQADELGTRLLASTGYAADGLYNLMVTLKQQEKMSPPSWLASHPATDDRIDSLQNLIGRNGYNRYAYEGVARHSQIKAQVKKLVAQKEQQEQKKHQD